MKKAFPWLRDRAERSESGKVLIRGEKVVIREKRLEDIADDYAWRTDDELARLDATGPIKMSYQEFVRYSKEELIYAGASSKRLAIDTLDGHHIGNCMYYDISNKRGEAELGIMIGDRGYWSKGYGTDTVNTLLNHIFTTTSLTRVYLHTLEWNHRAQRSFEKVGFRHVKKLRRSGLDFILMETLKPDWERRRAESEAVSPSHDGATNHGAVSTDGPAPEAVGE